MIASRIGEWVGYGTWQLHEVHGAAACFDLLFAQPKKASRGTSVFIVNSLAANEMARAVIPPSGLCMCADEQLNNVRADGCAGRPLDQFCFRNFHSYKTIGQHSKALGESAKSFSSPKPPPSGCTSGRTVCRSCNQLRSMRIRVIRRT